jgi:hypothetical protein
LVGTEPHKGLIRRPDNVMHVLTLFCYAGPWYVWLAYSLFILFTFAAIKAINQTLHRLFDTGEVHEITDSTAADGSLNTTTAAAIALADLGYESISGGFELRPIRPEPKQQRSPPSPIVAPPPRTVRTSSTPPSEERESRGIRSRRGGGRGLVREDSSHFDLKVDVHTSRQELAAASSVEPDPHERGIEGTAVDKAGKQPENDRSDECEEECHSGDVVIVVEEGSSSRNNGQRHTAHAQTVLEEAESPCRINGGGSNAYDVSFSTNSSSQQIACNTATATASSSQITMPGFRRADRYVPGTWYFYRCLLQFD